MRPTTLAFGGRGGNLQESHTLGAVRVTSHEDRKVYAAAVRQYRTFIYLN